MLMAMPLIILSLGLGIWFINAFLFLGVAAFLEGFYVDGFRNAMAGSFTVSITELLAKYWFGAFGIKVRVHPTAKPPQNRDVKASKDLDKDEVIDV